MIKLLKEIKDLKINIRLINGKLDISGSKGTITDEILQRIKVHKEELVLFIEKYSLDKLNYDQIPVVEESVSYPLSPSQFRLWVLSQFESGSVVYNIPWSLRLHAYNIDNFKKSVYSVIDRHEILRTVFRKDDSDDIRQWILSKEAIGFEIKEIDFRKNILPDAAVREYIKSDSLVSFDLEKGPLLRAVLLRVSATDYVFYYNMHHIISDGWSAGVLSQDFLSYYNHYNDPSSKLPLPLRIQYKDYASWYLSALNSPSFALHRDYWLGKLQGDLPVIDLPSNRIRPVLQTHCGRTLGTYLSEDLSCKLKAYCMANGGTLFMGLIASLEIILYRYTGQEDLILGTSVAGRDHLDLDNQIGFYLNTLILRNSISHDNSFEEIFAMSRDTIFEAYKHQYYPFDRLIQELSQIRDTSRNAVYDISVVLQNFEERQGNADLKEESGKIHDYGEGVSKNDIEFTFHEVGDYIHMGLNYNTDIYDKASMEGFINHYRNILEQLLLFPERKIGEHQYISIAEQQILLKGFNTTGFEYAQDKTLVDLFRDQAASTPDCIAIIFGEKKISYKELDELSDQFMLSLQSREIGPNELIGVSLDKSDCVIISILGILKNGCGYVPIDTDYPLSRKQYMLQDSKISLLVTESSYLFDIDYEGAVFVFDIEFNPGVIDKKVSSLSLSPDSIAYVIYTSGSTGNPKGVIIDHRGICNTVLDHVSRFNLKDTDRVLQFLSLSFDGSVLDIFMALLSGSALVIPSRDVLGNIEAMVSLIEKHRVSVATLPPSYLRLLDGQDLSSIRLMVSAGEAIDIPLSLKYSKEKIFYNGYGPTEASVNTTLYEIDKNKDYSGGIPIGKPSRNKHILILDTYNKLTPVGVIGELCVGGIGLAQGYLNLSELTAERFINNPYDATEKLYRTGDLACWLSDGNIMYKGRADDQVKIRGYRIELGEIENVILSHPEINEVVVLVKSSFDMEKKLVGYYISRTKLAIHELRNYLSLHLPIYMIPNYFVQMESMPLTPNGKIDKKSLPSPEDLDVLNESQYVAPRNEIEKKLVGIVAGILKVKEDRVGIEDNFFDLGANSINMIKILDEINKYFHLNLNIVQLFQFSNIKLIVSEILQDEELSVKYENLNDFLDEIIG